MGCSVRNKMISHRCEKKSLRINNNRNKHVVSKGGQQSGPRLVGLNSYSTHMCSGRWEHVVCVNKCAWIPINCVWEGGFFSYCCQT